MEVAVPHTKLELLKDGLVVHEVQGVEHVTPQLQTDRQTDRQTDIQHTSVHPLTVLCIAYTFCCNECIEHEVLEGCLCAEVVKGVD